YRVRLNGADPRAAAQQLRGAHGIAYASPNWTVSSMALEPRAIPAAALEQARAAAARRSQLRAASPATVPTNYGLASSFESWLNAGGVDAVGAFDILDRRFGVLPGEGVIVTNVSVGDLTDQSMADGGDQYVQFFGPTTIISG